MRDQRFEGPYVSHGNDAALDATAKELAGELLALSFVEGRIPRPAMSLRVDVGEQFRESAKFDKSVESEGDGPAVLSNHRGWGDQSLKRNFLSMESSAENRNQE